MVPYVLIAGAGPTGLTLAIELARRQLPVRIVDKADSYFVGSRGDGLQPRTLEVFEDLGVLDTVLTRGIPVPETHVYLDGQFDQVRRMAPHQDPTPDVPYPNGWMLGQSETEGILRDRLAELGVRVELATAVHSFEQDADGVTATLSTGERVRAEYLVGADGGGSTVRKTLGIPFQGTTDDSIRSLLGDVRADTLDHDHAYMFAPATDPRVAVGLTPLAGGTHFQFAAPLPEGTDAEPTLEALQTALDRASAGADIPLTDLTWGTVWRPNIRLAARFRAGRVFLAGDAAHAHPPTGGQGLNTGVQDAYNLGWKLADGSPDLLDSYEIERRGVAAEVLDLSTKLLRKHVNGDADAHERGAETRQLGIGYRTEPASAGKIRAGDRAPDAPLLDARGNPIRLFDLFRGPHATTLIFGSGEHTGEHVYRITAEPDGESLVDADGHAFAAYDATDGTRVHVRPDGYVGEFVPPNTAVAAPA